MADNTILNTNTTTGDTVRDIDRQYTGIKTQTVQLDFGGDKTQPENLASVNNPLPVRNDEEDNLLTQILVELRVQSLMLREALLVDSRNASKDDLDKLREDERINLTMTGDD